MLTIEMLRQNTALSNLDETILSAIADMSRNDEANVIGSRIGELHGKYDADVLSITGLKKNDGEKSYEYVKRVLNHYKASLNSVDTLKGELASANAKITELNAKIESGNGDEAIRQQLKDTKKQVEQLQKQLVAKETEYVNEKAKYEKSISDIHVDYAFSQAASKIKFKDGVSETVKNIMLNAAKAEILAKGTPELVEENGNRKLVLRDADGNILNNVKNNLNPYTVEELLMESSIKDLVDMNKKQTGTGTQPFSTTRNNQVTLDLAGATTQLAADKAIESYLLANGLTRDSEEFAAQSLQLRTENNVADLPIR